ncbi:restriction endonuclease subunit S, partial [Helicobacter suis]|uniref:restriction endonuclease subunit S n=1 Tax=Helicobacter suis TaxID=104628 RepID=UPI0013D2EB29
CLKNTNISSFAAVDIQRLQRYALPLPPLLIQERIVTILDCLTELTAELTARKKQFHYYLNALLDFGAYSLYEFNVSKETSYRLVEQVRTELQKSQDTGTQVTPLKDGLNPPTSLIKHPLLKESFRVEWVRLGEVLDYEQPTKYIVNSTSYDDAHKTPVLTAGQTFILGYTNETQGVYLATPERPCIIFDDFTTSFHWVDFAFKVKSSAIKILTLKEPLQINFKFVFYAMKCIRFNPTQHERHWIKRCANFPIPLPPLPIQEKIASILDQLQALSSDLEQGIPAEIRARKKQFNYYLNHLLDFKGQA